MLHADDLYGIQSFVPTVFTRSGLIDEDRNRENFRRLIGAGMHGIQILGGAAEPFSISTAEHETMVRLLMEEVGRAPRRVFTIVGCGSHGLYDAVDRAKIAARHGADAGMFVLPHFFAVSPVGAVRYFEKIAEAVPSIALVHYNSAKAKTILTGRDYRNMKHITQLIGTKQAGRTGPQWRDLKKHAGHLNHFDCDDEFVYSFMNGATAVDLLISAMRPRLSLALYQACVNKEWDRALRLQQHVWDIMNDLNYGLVETWGYADCTGDKALVEASGFLHAAAVRPPYVPMTAEHLAVLRERMDAYPDTEEPRQHSTRVDR